ncbi:hypothetical protein N0V90_009373 [Kalmusia sp. IMI 367209]|nr:hypothetical protein N0V90_009373 [Kalmusia sp. IMI 367209]
MSPVRSKHIPPTSPLQRMTSPFTRQSLSLRTRSKIRIGILVTAIVLLVCVLNELRCMKYGCDPRIRIFGGGRKEGGGAVLPDDWKYRLGEQLKLNMQGTTPPKDAPTTSQKDHPKKEHSTAPAPNGTLVSSSSPPPALNAAGKEAGDGRWIDAPPSPDRETKAQMKAEKKTYVDGQDVESLPPKTNTRPAEASSDDHTHPANTTTPSVVPAKQDKVQDAAAKKPANTTSQGDASQPLKPPPPPLNKGNPPSPPNAKNPDIASSPPSSSAAQNPSLKSGSSGSSPPTPDHRLDSAPVAQQHSGPPAENNFGSMEMGLLMAGGVR